MATITTCDKCHRTLRDTEARYEVAAIKENAGPGAWEPVMREVCEPCVKKMMEPYPGAGVERKA